MPLEVVLRSPRRPIQLAFHTTTFDRFLSEFSYLITFLTTWHPALEKTSQDDQRLRKLINDHLCQSIHHELTRADYFCLNITDRSQFYILFANTCQEISLTILTTYFGHPSLSAAGNLERTYTDWQRRLFAHFIQHFPYEFATMLAWSRQDNPLPVFAKLPDLGGQTCGHNPLLS